MLSDERKEYRALARLKLLDALDARRTVPALKQHGVTRAFHADDAERTPPALARVVVLAVALETSEVQRDLRTTSAACLGKFLCFAPQKSEAAAVSCACIYI